MSRISHESVGCVTVPVVWPDMSRTPLGVVVMLHDHPEDGKSLGEDVNRLGLEIEPLLSQGLVVLCPEGGASWWLDQSDGASWDQWVSSVVPRWVSKQADRLGSAVEAPLALAGVGMGGQGALAIAFRSPRRVPIVAAIQPAVDLHTAWRATGTAESVSLRSRFLTAEAARQHSAILFVRPLDPPMRIGLWCDPDGSPWWDGAERLRSKLSSLRLTHEADLTTLSRGDNRAYHRWAFEQSAVWLASAMRTLGKNRGS